MKIEIKREALQHLPLLNSKETGQSLCQDSVRLSYKGAGSESPQCVTPIVPASPTQSCCYLRKAATDQMYVNEHGYVQIKLYVGNTFNFYIISTCHEILVF